MKRTASTAAAALLAAGPLLFAGFAAQAHAHLVKSTPAANAIVASPKALDLQFSERLEPKFSGVALMTAKGVAVPVTAKVSGKTIHAVTAGALAPGGYMAMWHVVSADGHKMKGQYDFTVK